jgi:hypothetical protein
VPGRSVGRRGGCRAGPGRLDGPGHPVLNVGYPGSPFRAIMS